MSPYFTPKMITSPYPSPSPPHFPAERKLKKPLMEKRRRARMNECLDQLKQLLLHIAPHQRSKLEKADILEMTVAYLNQLHQSGAANPAVAADAAAAYRQSYVEGFSTAASACLAYLQNALLATSLGAHSQQVRLGLVQHLQSVMSSQMRRAADECSSSGGGSAAAYAPPGAALPASIPATATAACAPSSPAHAAPLSQPLSSSCAAAIMTPVFVMSPEKVPRYSVNGAFDECHTSCLQSPASEDSFGSDAALSPSSTFSAPSLRPALSPQRQSPVKVWRPF